MYVRKKHNKSGTTSIVVVSKASGKYKEIKSFGASSSEEEISLLYEKAKAWIHSFAGQQELDFDGSVTILGDLTIHANNFATLNKKNFTSTTPLKQTLNILILALNDSAFVLVSLLSTKLKIMS